MNQWVAYSKISKNDPDKYRETCFGCYKEYGNFKVFPSVKDKMGNIISDLSMVCRRINNFSMDDLDSMGYINFDPDLGYYSFKI